jgi:hypothetical protein
MIRSSFFSRYESARRCWTLVPSERPSFGDLVAAIKLPSIHQEELPDVDGTRI